MGIIKVQKLIQFVIFFTRAVGKINPVGSTHNVCKLTKHHLVSSWSVGCRCRRCYDDLMQMRTQLLNKILCIKYILNPVRKRTLCVRFYSRLRIPHFGFRIEFPPTHTLIHSFALALVPTSHSLFVNISSIPKLLFKLHPMLSLLYCSMHKNGINLNVICKVCSLARRIYLRLNSVAVSAIP